MHSSTVEMLFYEVQKIKKPYDFLSIPLCKVPLNYIQRFPQQFHDIRTYILQKACGHFQDTVFIWLNTAP